MNRRTGMIDRPDDIVIRLMERADRTGVPEYEVYVVQRRGLAIAAREGRIEQVRRQDELSASLRMIDRGCPGFAYTTVFTNEAFERTVAQARAGARLADAQPGLGLPEPPVRPWPRVNGDDPSMSQVSQQEKMLGVLEMEAAALEVDRRVERVRQAEYRESDTRVWLANSHGLEYQHAASVFTGGIMVKAAQDGEAEMGFESDFSRIYRQLDLKAIGRQAARRALNNLGGRRIGTGGYPVILENRAAADFLGVLAGSFLADHVHKGKSLLAGRKNLPVMAKEINLCDDGLFPGGLATSPADGEGVPCQKTPLIDQGVLKGYLYDTTRARLDGMASTGNAGRGTKSPPGIQVTNFILSPGSKTPQDLAHELGDGLLVTDVMGMHTANAISGDFSVGVSGTWLRSGEPDHPVKGMALAGNILTMFRRVGGVGSDLRLFGTIGAPSLLVEGLTLSGL